MFRKWVRFSSLFKILTIMCLGALLLAYLAPYVHPNTFKILPFFGLAYPVILIITILSLIVWIIAKSRIVFLILFVLILGGKLHFRLLTLGSNIEEIPTTANTLTILSNNVHLLGLYSGNEQERITIRNGIFEYIHTIDPDIMCFQEFYHQDKPTSFTTRDSILQFMKIKDYHERYAHKLRGRQNFGVIVLSKYPMIAKGDVMFETQNKDDFNYCIYVDVVKDQDTFRIYNVHLQSIRLQREEQSVFDNEAEQKPSRSTIRLLFDKLNVAYPKRADQARKVMEHASTSPYPTIICGDFNDTPMSYTYHQFSKHLTDAYRNTSKGIGATYVGKVPAGRIDYIFHSEGLNSTDFRIQETPFSDHRAISCTIIKE
jgi:endonuclease/exonuclease/phosphatase family metal-dependent hydrolase